MPNVYLTHKCHHQTTSCFGEIGNFDVKRKGPTKSPIINLEILQNVKVIETYSYLAILITWYLIFMLKGNILQYFL